MKRAISVLITVLMVFLLAVPAFAADSTTSSTQSVMSPQFTNIWSMSASVTIDASGLADCSGSVTPSSNAYTTTLTISLQLKSGSTWSTIKSWSGAAAGQPGTVLEGFYYVGKGTYRVSSTANVYTSIGGLLETATYSSPERTL